MNTNNLSGKIFAVVSFFTFCSILYQIAFWSVFGVNGLAYISLQDVLKTTIIPASPITLFGFLVGVYCGIVLENKNTSVEKTKTPIWLFILFFGVLIFPYFLGAGVKISEYTFEIIFFSIFCLILAVLERIDLSGVLGEIKYPKALLSLSAILPLFYFMVGYFDAKDICENKKYIYTFQKLDTLAHNNTEVLKLLLNGSENYILCNMNNTKIVVLNKTQINPTVFYMYPKYDDARKLDSTQKHDGGRGV